MTASKTEGVKTKAIICYIYSPFQGVHFTEYMLFCWMNYIYERENNASYQTDDDLYATLFTAALSIIT